MTYTENHAPDDYCCYIATMNISRREGIEYTNELKHQLIINTLATSELDLKNITVHLGHVMIVSPKIINNHLRSIAGLN